jgi:hypothetical protein
MTSPFPSVVNSPLTESSSADSVCRRGMAGISGGDGVRIMVHAERQVRLIGELLQFELPQTHARPIRAAAIGRDRQFFHVRIAFADAPTELSWLALAFAPAP